MNTGQKILKINKYVCGLNKQRDKQARKGLKLSVGMERSVQKRDNGKGQNGSKKKAVWNGQKINKINRRDQYGLRSKN